MLVSKNDVPECFYRVLALETGPEVLKSPAIIDLGAFCVEFD